MTKTKLNLCVLIMLLTFVISACSSLEAEKIQLDNQFLEWVVIEDTEPVKPYKGIAERIIKLKGYRVIDWLDNDRVLAYKYSDSVFGEDRGIVSLNVQTGEILKTYDSLGTFKNGSVSPDKSICIYSLESSESWNVAINILDLETGRTTRYQGDTVPALMGLNTYNFQQLVTWYDDHSAIIALSTHSNQMTFGEVIGTKLYIHDFVLAKLTRDSPFYTTSSFIKKGDSLIGFAMLDKGGFLLKGDLKDYSVQKIPIEKSTEIISLMSEDRIAVSQNTSENTEAVRLINDEGKVVRTLTKFENLETLKAYDEVFIYILQKDRVETVIGRYDMATGSDNIIATYTDVWINEFYLSPDGQQLILNFNYGGQTDGGRPVSHLIMMK